MLAAVRKKILHGPPVGGGPFYTSGLLGVAKDAVGSASLQTLCGADKGTVQWPQDTRGLQPAL